MRQVELPIYPVVYPTGHRLNQNESQFPLPDRIKNQLDSLTYDDLHEYPVEPINELFERYAAYVGVTPEQLLVGCGSDEMIHVVTQALLAPHDIVLSPAPDFSMYPIFTTIAHGHHVQAVDLSYEGMVKAIETHHPKLLLLSNPNNPTGKLWTVEELTHLASIVPYIVVDEAYMDFTPDASMIPFIATLPNLIVLRTMSKAFGLANVRIGFMVTNCELAHYFRQFIPPFNISGVSAKICNIFLKDASYLQETIEWHDEMRQKWALAFESIGHVLPASTNFLYIELEQPKAVWAHFTDLNIHTSKQPTGIRVTIGDETALHLAYSAIQKYKKTSHVKNS
ncbi:histidinol-phosphate aminotransferase family protein [Exiguobacterium profundum]|uniref:histidinol-phosphate transaminase n=1 Tax=Exiguobacterium profundum TaxID=307643 RepID=A0ABY8B0H9_9BACL|nr:histidinol-phosphate transaminase [Exiguobacterium profundum]WED54059.1 histidinol-phosphate aminotransferase family protein [Exiguobacterium profundum]